VRTTGSVTPELTAAYSLCERKAFLTLRGDVGGPTHEYVTYLAARAGTAMRSFLGSLKDRGVTVYHSESVAIDQEAGVILNVTLKADIFEANVDALICLPPTVSNPQPLYEPYLFVGTHTITGDQKMHLGCVEHVLVKAHRCGSVKGAIVMLMPQAKYTT
jgi:hypothetical protein